MNKKIIALASLMVLVLLPMVALAASPTPAEWFKGIIDRLLEIIVWPLFIASVVIMLIYAGFLFVTAAGDVAKLSRGKSAFIWALVGIAVGIAAFSAVNIIEEIIGETPVLTCGESVAPTCGGECVPGRTCTSTSVGGSSCFCAED
ncbi:MAG: hypothetical protein A2908_02000 [Candidatus Staskawiczbacteria bacterium RIFCSPLOWO2_01_FULL_38_12b]|uniref:TrbC/VirB2 family protein n=1 Tax=Candidatus Staskawiczbacteria bacterium RIFCSPLOWO2_01_FULL_38_12b TaxID=1802214 RepID=A0A1G2IEF3_9BACT|nr:MAG: hypothetical protein A2908_02000 [Candidatus Staskawiczbacteria bacterium RIFCSPLOWO2_01_FULL_38_12b]QBM02626.1 hypothetical protein [uncultured archaeon]